MRKIRVIALLLLSLAAGLASAAFAQNAPQIVIKAVQDFFEDDGAR